MAAVLRRTLLAALASGGMVAGLHGAARAGDPSAILVLGTGPDGGALLAYGAAFVDSMKIVDANLVLREKPTRGSVDNVPMLERREIDLGFVIGEMAYEVLAGIGRPAADLKIVAAMYPTPGMFAVRADSRYYSIDELKGRPVVWNARGSGLAVQGRYVMAGLGLDPDKDFEAIYTQKLSEGPELVLDGMASALWGGGLRWPSFVTLASHVRGARFIVPSSAEIETILAKQTFLGRLTVPAGLYPGQREPLESVGSWTFVMSRSDLDERIAYRIAADLYRIERAGLATRQLGQTTVANTMKALPDRAALHPGVARFYREQGLMP